MGYSISANRNVKAYGMKHFTVDFEKDIETLPTNCTPGSTAFCIENSKDYMLNTSRKWKEVQLGNGSGGGSGGGDDSGTQHLIYDGIEII